MRRIHLTALGVIAPDILTELARGISSEFRTLCEVQPAEAEPAFAYNPTRQQYSSTEILAYLHGRVTSEQWRVLAVTPVDLYIPILTFVFGEAQLEGPCALVSMHRLRQEFYGLPPDGGMLRKRLLKEAIHELGHTMALSHCDDYQCVMSPSHSVEWIDLKTYQLCGQCRMGLPTNGASQVHKSNG